MQIALVLLLATLIGLILGAVGGGGSILAVPVLVGVAGLAVTDATTASLVVVGTSALIGLLSDLRSGRVRVGAGLVFGLTGVGGAYLGTQVHQQVNDSVMLVLFAALMLAVAAKMALNLRQGAQRAASVACGEAPDGTALETVLDTTVLDTTVLDTTVLTGATARPAPALGERGSVGLAATPSPAATSPAATSPAGTSPAATGTCREVAGINTCLVVRLLLAGTAVGFLTGLFGVGGGFVIVPALMLVLKFDITEAAATSLLVIAINSFVALAMRGGVSAVDWSVVAPFTAFATVGVLAGRRVAHRVPARALTTALTVLIVVVAVWTASKGIAGL